MLLSASAHSGPNYGLGTLNYDGWPPARFIGDATSRVSWVKPELVAKACDEPDPDHTLEACQDGGHIVLPNPCTFPKSDDFARLACHELAHQRGWAADHPR